MFKKLTNVLERSTHLAKLTNGVRQAIIWRAYREV